MSIRHAMHLAQLPPTTRRSVLSLPHSFGHVSPRFWFLGIILLVALGALGWVSWRWLRRSPPPPLTVPNLVWRRANSTRQPEQLTPFCARCSSQLQTQVLDRPDPMGFKSVAYSCPCCGVELARFAILPDQP
jgi:hypothetical protein